MNNVYFKNYGIWLGGAIVLAFIAGFANIGFYGLSYLMVLIGTIVGTVFAHKENGGNISFGKAVGPVMILIGVASVLNVIIHIANWGTEYFGFALPFMITSLFVEAALAISVLLATGTWYMFEKAGKPGWAMIVPIYNIIIMLEIAKKPMWYIAMFFVPIANIVFLIMMLNGISKNFGKSEGFTVGLVFLRQIFLAILGYGDAQYIDTIKNKTDDAVIDQLAD